MIKLITSGVVAYISTSIDYLIILMLIFGQVKTPKQRLSVYLGDFFGTSILVAAALFFAFVLKFIPAEWVLGLLGLIPIYMGLRLFIKGEDDDGEAVVAKRMSTNSNLVVNVILITVATCGADNIGIYVPFFTQLQAAEIGVVLITFFVMLTLFCFIGYSIVKLPFIAAVLERFGRWITASVYTLLGLYILWESGTFAKLLSFLA
ncbi:MAG: CadD family cadmium resistance transporter [Lactobacillus sp.]|jgi:cadmium resistance transport/sequestration family protein|nr:CadD family cadmium resistance transporter [Lactobacillus sp.]